MRAPTIDPFYRRLFSLAFIGVFLYALFLLKSVIAPFAAAFVLAYFLNPLVSKLSKIMPRMLAIVTVYASSIVLVVALFIWFVPLLWSQLQILWESLPAMVHWYNDVARAWILQHTGSELLPLDADILSNAALQFVQENYQFADAQSFIKNALSSGMSVANSAGLVVMVPILTFYFLLGWRKRLATWAAAIPTRYQAKTIAVARDCDDALMSFAKGQLLVMVLLGATYAIQLELIGLKVGLIIGITAGIASFVPYLGFGIGIISALVAGVFQFGFDWVYLGLICGAFLVGQVVEGYILQPLLLGNKIGLSPLWIIFAVLAGAALFGFVGMLIALPVSAVLNVLFYHAYDSYQNSRWYTWTAQKQNTRRVLIDENTQSE